jgi:hypothetical protein
MRAVAHGPCEILFAVCLGSPHSAGGDGVQIGGVACAGPCRKYTISVNCALAAIECWQVSTHCPATATECVEEPTICPPVPTECPVIANECGPPEWGRPGLNGALTSLKTTPSRLLWRRLQCKAILSSGAIAVLTKRRAGILGGMTMMSAEKRSRPFARRHA